MMEELKEIVTSDTMKNEARNLLENAIGVFKMDPLAAMDLICQLRNLPSTIRDGIYWENFYNYLIHVYDIDDAGRIRCSHKKKLAEMLTEQLPNEDAGYEGDTDKLSENAKRLVKIIDDAGTIQKTIYYSKLTVAALDGIIDRGKFFKLCNCVRNLTEEDLTFLISDIRRTGKNTIKEDRDNIDDFRAAGLLKEVDGGFTYTIRAFELMKYGLAADDNIQIPKEIQERMMAGMIKLEDIVNVDGETLVVNGGTVTD